MKRLLMIGIIGAAALWLYQGPMGGHLPRLTKIKSGAILQISSTAFTNNGDIPVKYTCSGAGINPELEFSGIPADARSLALIVEDPDATNGTFTHWVVFNIPPSVKSIPEAVASVPGIQAKNGAGTAKYQPPCPPSGIHRYYFKLYALDTMLPSDDIVDKSRLQTAMTGHILDSTMITGKFKTRAVMKLSEKKCVACEGGMPPFTKKQSLRYLRKLNKGWKIKDNKLEREFKFKNFVQSMGFANQVALIAQAEDHHPEIEISYSKVEIEIWTHAVGGLSENDFILAAKIDQLKK